MRCPFCGEPETKVIDSRLVGEINAIKRRRECISCGVRFNTSEQSEFKLPHSAGRSSFVAHAQRKKDRKTIVASFIFIGLTSNLPSSRIAPLEDKYFKPHVPQIAKVS